MELVIRKAEEADFEGTYPLFEQLWPTMELDAAALHETFVHGIRSDSDELLCAEMGGKVIGFCAFAMVNNLWQAGRISYVYALVVDENCRGQGIGTAIIGRVIERARELGLKRVELDSGFQREKAHRFYENLGFLKRAYLFSYPL